MTQGLESQSVDRRSQAWSFRFPILLFLALAAVLYLVSWWAHSHQPLSSYYNPEWDQASQFTGDWALRGWARWDSGWYMRIAESGYYYTPGLQSPVAYFPVYPLTMRGVGLVTGDPLLAGIAISASAGLGIAILFYRWCCDRMSTLAARLSLAALLLFPYAWYLFGAVYADAVFVLAAVGAFVLADRRQLWGAAACGMIATAARPVGLALAAALVILVLEQRGVLRLPERARLGGRQPAEGSSGDDASDGAVGTRTEGPFVDRTRIHWPDAVVLLSVLGLATWSAYLWIRFGDPFAFSSVESAPGWDHGPGPNTWFKVRIWEMLNGDVVEPPGYLQGVLVQGALALAFLATVPAAIRRFGRGYGVYVLLVVTFPLISSKDLQGLGRYLLAAFPVFALIGLALADRPIYRKPVLIVSGLLLVMMTSLFARGYYLA